MDNDESRFWTIIAVALGLLFLWAMMQPPEYGDNCYDADPTQWTDIICD